MNEGEDHRDGIDDEADPEAISIWDGQFASHGAYRVQDSERSPASQGGAAPAALVARLGATVPEAGPPPETDARSAIPDAPPVSPEPATLAMPAPARPAPSNAPSAMAGAPPTPFGAPWIEAGAPPLSPSPEYAGRGEPTGAPPGWAAPGRRSRTPVAAGVGVGVGVFLLLSGVSALAIIGGPPGGATVGVWLVAAAAIVLLLVGGTLSVAFWRRRADGQSTAAETVVQEPAVEWPAVEPDRAAEDRLFPKQVPDGDGPHSAGRPPGRARPRPDRLTDQAPGSVQESPSASPRRSDPLPGVERAVAPSAEEAPPAPSPLPREAIGQAAPSAYARFVPPRAGGTVGELREWGEGEVIVDRYRVGRKIVSGMGVVYLCHDTVAGVPIAIKTCRDISVSADGLGGGRGDALLARLFESEALIWIRLGRHPNVVEARYAVELNGKPHLFLELVGDPDGRERTLRHLMRTGGLAPERAIQLALQVCAGLEHALSIFPGLVHRDLKPENLLIADDEVVKVTDFGLTRVFADVTGRVATLAGTPAYMSPEQCLGLSSLDTRSDVYSLGVILYEMVAGRRPFRGNLLQAHLTELPPDPRELVAEVPATLASAIGRCLAKRPEERYASFAELRAALLACYVEVTGQMPRLPEPAARAPDQRAQAGIDLARAISLATLGHYDEAVDLLDRAVSLDPGYAEAWRWRGVGLNALGQAEEAARCFERALALAPEDVDTWLEQGRLLSRLGRRDEALASFDAALAVDSVHVAARYERGTTLFFLGRYDEAVADLEQAYAQQPGPALAAAVQACGRRVGATESKADGSGIDGLPSPASVQPTVWRGPVGRT